MKRHSILTDDLTVSFISGNPAECIHHIYGGFGRRDISEREGFIVPLTNSEHNFGAYAVHFNRELDLMLKRYCQRAYEEMGHSREDFIKLIGKNYLD